METRIQARLDKHDELIQTLQSDVGELKAAFATESAANAEFRAALINWMKQHQPGFAEFHSKWSIQQQEKQPSGQSKEISNSSDLNSSESTLVLGKDGHHGSDTPRPSDDKEEQDDQAALRLLNLNFFMDKKEENTWFENNLNNVSLKQEKSNELLGLLLRDGVNSGGELLEVEKSTKVQTIDNAHQLFDKMFQQLLTPIGQFSCKVFFVIIDKGIYINNFSQTFKVFVRKKGSWYEVLLLGNEVWGKEDDDYNSLDVIPATIEQLSEKVSMRACQTLKLFGAITYPPKSMGGCGHEILEWMHIKPFDSVSKLLEKTQHLLKMHKLEDMHEMLVKWCLCSNFVRDSDGGDQQLHRVASRENSKDNYLYCPRAIDIQPRDLKFFQWHGSKGESVIVSNAFERTLGLNAEPMVMSSAMHQIYSYKMGYGSSTKFIEYGEIYKTKTKTHKHDINLCMVFRRCLDWCEVDITLQKFFAWYMDYIFDVEGWPTLEDKKVKLLKESLKPDMDPKVYIAYAIAQESGHGDFFTKRHCEKSVTILHWERRKQRWGLEIAKMVVATGMSKNLGQKLIFLLIYSLCILLWRYKEVDQKGVLAKKKMAVINEFMITIMEVTAIKSIVMVCLVITHLNIILWSIKNRVQKDRRGDWKWVAINGDSFARAKGLMRLMFVGATRLGYILRNLKILFISGWLIIWKVDILATRVVKGFQDRVEQWWIPWNGSVNEEVTTNDALTIESFSEASLEDKTCFEGGSNDANPDIVIKSTNDPKLLYVYFRRTKSVNQEHDLNRAGDFICGASRYFDSLIRFVSAPTIRLRERETPWNNRLIDCVTC